MSKILTPFARLLLGLWVGAVAGIVFAVAPAVFGGIQDPAEAGRVMAPIFERVDYFGIVAAAVFALAAWPGRVRAALAALLGAAAATNILIVAPRIAARGDDFDFFHRLSEGLWGFILVAGVVLMLIGPRGKAKK